ncbi:MAG: hypothetical protein ACE5KO_07010, partial [Candidatus Bathyarchaeia archaeon]
MEAEKLTSLEALDILYDKLVLIGEKIHEWDSEETGEIFYLGDTQGIIASSYFASKGQLNRLGEKVGIAIGKGHPTVLSAVGFEKGILYDNVQLEANESWGYVKDNLTGLITLRRGIVSHENQLLVWSPSTTGRMAIPEGYIGGGAETSLPLFGSRTSTAILYKTSVV